MTKPNNSWEIEFYNRDLGCCGGDGCPHYVVRQDENGNNVGTNHDEVLKDFITKTLQQQREEVNEILLDCWQQFACENETGYWSGGLSTLESLEWYLKNNNLIDDEGKVKSLSPIK